MMDFNASLDHKTRRERERPIFAFFATSLTQRAIGIFCQFAQVPIALHYLGSEAFGLWVTLTTLNFIVWCSDFGVGFGVQSMIADALSRGDSERARRTFVTGFGFLLGIMVLLLAVSVSSYFLLDLSRLLRFTYPRLTTSANAALLWVAVIWCVNIPLGLGQRLAHASQVGWMSNIANSVTQLLTLAIVSIAAWLQLGIGTFFLLSFGTGALVSFLFLLFMLHYLNWCDFGLNDFEHSLLGDISRLGLHFFLQQVATMVMYSSPPIILSMAFGAASVTSYNLVQRILGLFGIVTTAFLVPLWPAYADAKAKVDWLWIRRTLLHSLVLVCGLAILPMLAVGRFVPTFINWWTNGLAATTPQSLVWLLIAWNALSLFQQPFGYLLVGLSEIKRASLYSVLSAAAALASISLLVPKLGVNALPIGLIIGFVPFILGGTVCESIYLLNNQRRQRSKIAGSEPVPSL